MISRLQLRALKQDNEEGIWNFTAHVKGQADICKFNMTAPAHAEEREISYRDQMVQDTIICGLEDPEI